MKAPAIIILVMIMSIIAGGALAEEKPGVAIYPGAVSDSATTKAFGGSSGNMAFYTTEDDIAKVFEFYKKQPGLKPMGTGLTTNPDGRRQAAFNGDNIMVTIERPHLDMTAAKFDKKKGITGKMIDNTLISIQRY